MPDFVTNPRDDPSRETADRAFVRMKITDLSVDGESDQVKAVRYSGPEDGTTVEGLVKYVVLAATGSHVVGDTIYATRPAGGTGRTFADHPIVWLELQAPPAGDLLGKVSSYTPGENTVSLTPCDSAGTPTGDPDVDVSITLPASRTVCSIVDINTDDVLAYRVTGALKYLTSVPLPKSVTQRDVLSIQGGSGLSGFDTVRFK